MRRVMIAVFVVLLAPILIAAGWNKAYFAATKPGSWATIRVTSTMTPPFTTTSTRLPDVDGRVVIEQRTESRDSASPLDHDALRARKRIQRRPRPDRSPESGGRRECENRR